MDDICRALSGGVVPRALTNAQLGLWYAQRLDPANPIFNTGHYTVIDGPLDVPALAGAVAGALAEADGLTVSIRNDHGEPVQWIGGAPVPVLEVLDLCRRPSPEEEAQAWMAQDGATPIDPICGPLVRTVLFAVGEERHFWYLRVHHLVSDHYGIGLVTRRVAELYAAQVAGHPPGQPLMPYVSLLDEEEDYRRSPRCGVDRDYWLALLADRPAAPGLVAGAAVTGRSWHRGAHRLDEKAMAALRALADRAEVSWPDALAALIAAYLHRHLPGNTVADEGDGILVAGIACMNRLGSVAARVPAMVTNVLPVPLLIAEEKPIEEFLAGAARAMAQARRHGRYRSEHVRRHLGFLGGLQRLCTAQINILPFDDALTLPGMRTQTRILGTGPVDDLTVTARGDGTIGPLRLEINVNPDLYGVVDAADHAGRLACFIAGATMVHRLVDVPTLTPDEHHRWITLANGTRHRVDGTTLVDTVGRFMRLTPQAVAVAAGGRILSYSALDRVTGCLARRLASAGIGRGDIVAVAVPRSLELMVALIAVLRAGAAYLPIDPGHPTGRTARIIAEAGPRLGLVSPASTTVLPAHLPVWMVDVDDAMAGGEDGGGALPPPPQPDDAAYVIFTSGSTGTPKGVVIEHAAVLNRLEWMRAAYGIASDDRVLQKTPAMFDVSVWEFFLPLIAGATVVMAPPEAHRDPAWLVRLIREEGITTIHFVPSMLAAFLSEPTAAGTVLRRVFCSGEELPAALRDRFHTVVRAELHNLYGPTETTVDVTFWPAGPDDHSVPVPIGYPVWNTALYVLDRWLRPVPPGVAGHLYVAGRQLARGYLNRPDLTAERFLDDPFGSPGARMYRTGDLARRRPGDGVLEFLGRSDGQIKLRGFRIEPGEVAAILHAQPGVGQAVVVAREDGGRGHRLAAYVTPAMAGGRLDPTVLRDALAAHLPEAMCPDITVLPGLPVTVNGKLDRAALPVPATLRAPVSRPPRTATERRVAAIFRDVLERQAVISGADDDFFALGGHSLLAVQVIRRVCDEWPLTIGLGALFTHPSVAGFAAYIDALGVGDGQTMAAGREGLETLLRLVDAGPGTRPPVFCVHPASGLSWCYARLGRALGLGRSVYGLQAPLPAADGGGPTTLTAMAADYAARLCAMQADGPYHLIGWSIGGIIAQEMAVQLADAGRVVGVVALLDAYPSDCWRDQPEPDEAAALRAVAATTGLAGFQEPPTQKGLMGLLQSHGHPLAGLPSDTLAGIVALIGQNNRLVRCHHHRRFPGPLLHIRAALDHQDRDLTAARWAPYADAVEARAVPFRHESFTGPDATRCIAPHIISAITAFEDTGKGTE